MIAKSETGRLKAGNPVKDRSFGRFQWRTGIWERIFDRQVESIQSEIERAQAEDRIIVYLSCPISSRAGSYFRTNVDIAHSVARALMHKWGERVQVINPAAYQMESREGTGLILDHIRALVAGKDPVEYLRELRAAYSPGGGDYMRMWLRVLVEDDYLVDTEKQRRGKLCGGLFDAYYFIGPTDVATFFGATEPSLTSNVESYFARKCATDPEFRFDFDYSQRGATDPLNLAVESEAMTWETRRKEFVRYYTLRASAAFSRGSRDEWNTLVRTNKKRAISGEYGPGEELACYFDGRQVSAVSSGYEVSRGYELPHEDTVPSAPHPREIVYPTTASGRPRKQP